MTDRTFTPRQIVTAAISASLVIGEAEIEPQQALRSDLGADELDRVTIAMEIEELAEIEVSDAEMERCDTVDDLIRLTAEKMGVAA